MTMFSKTSVLRIGAVILAGAALFGCRKDTPRTAAAAPGRPATDPTAVWRILFVDSYHEGYPWNEGLLSGAKAVLNEHTTAGCVELEVIRMDAKRNTPKFSYRKPPDAPCASTCAPDSVIAADDAASKYLISPYYRDCQLPVIFCGVNGMPPRTAFRAQTSPASSKSLSSLRSWTPCEPMHAARAWAFSAPTTFPTARKRNTTTGDLDFRPPARSS